VIKVCTQIYGYPVSTQMDGPQEIPDPLTVLLLTVGGGGFDMMVKECVWNNDLSSFV
jgi:hypothetical protein